MTIPPTERDPSLPVTVLVVEDDPAMRDHLTQAIESGDYSRVGIMTAARNIDSTAGLLRDGLTLKMDATDAFIAEGTQIQLWSDADQLFVDVGDLSNLEGSLGVAG